LGDPTYLFVCLVQCHISKPAVLGRLAEVAIDVPSLVNWARQQFGTILFADQCNEVGFSQDPEDVALNGLVADVGMFNWLLFAASLDPDLVDVFSRGSSGGDQALKLLVPRFTFEEYCAFVRFNFPHFGTQ